MQEGTLNGKLAADVPGQPERHSTSIRYKTLFAVKTTLLAAIKVHRKLSKSLGLQKVLYDAC